MQRREFLKQTAGAAMAVVIPVGDPVADSAPVRWAASLLESALKKRGLDTRVRLSGPGRGVPSQPEAFLLEPEGDGSIHAAGADPRGLVYAVLELADRVEHGSGLALSRAERERPVNRIRSVARLFVSDVEDLGWYHDREFWPPYLTTLAANRFNRFSLTTGIGYDFTRQIRDCYFHFAYPFLMRVPGYDVRASQVSDQEMDANLASLRFIAEQTAARGLEFQLGLWTHAYEWTESPNANHIMSGLTPANHAAYCRAAIVRLLEAVPRIGGVTLRVHGESGVAEGSYDFWKTLFEGIGGTGRRVEIDLHAKGIDQKLIDLALATGMPVNVSPKFWAEHMGLPYHQAAIRELEMPPRDRGDQGFFALSSGSRRFMRYGVGDLLREDRKFGVLHRIWPGTQRLLLWGDPVTAAAYGHAFSFCGSAGVELHEPLSFKGRKGSGIAGKGPVSRCGYADATLAPRHDFEKFLYSYRIWGRALYSPAGSAEGWRRGLRSEMGSAAPAVEEALAQSSRILPLITTAHGPSAANNNYWPEMYTNMPIVDPAGKHPYSDSPAPKRFGTVSPFDPQMFSTIEETVARAADGLPLVKYTPLEVAQWLTAGADGALAALDKSARDAGAKPTTSYRRAALDIAIQAGIGRFFAAKLRAGIYWSLFERTGDRATLELALTSYRKAREVWVEFAERARGSYAADISFGYDRHLRGHWLDRVAAIDADIADMEKRLAYFSSLKAEEARRTLAALNAASDRPALPCRHYSAGTFRPSRPLTLELNAPKAAGVALYYRPVNQAETWRRIDMTPRGEDWSIALAAGVTASPYPLQYYFELADDAGRIRLEPGLAPPFVHQPYFVLRRA